MNTLAAKSALLLFCCNVACRATGQIISVNVVGYYNTPIAAGDNLIANQLDKNGTNTMNDTLNPSYGPAIPNGTTFTGWNAAAKTFWPVSTYNAATGWSINYNFNSFASGQGAILNSPSPWTNTFFGTVISYSNITPEFGGPLWHPNYADGLYLLACPEPLSGPMDFMFANVVGRAPEDGEWVKLLNPATQTYTTTTFNLGAGTWDNGDPSLGVGQAAWFDLGGPTTVPEPFPLALFGSGAVLLLLGRKHRQD